MEEKYIYVVVKRSGNSMAYDGWNDDAEIMYAFENQWEAIAYGKRCLALKISELCDSDPYVDYRVYMSKDDTEFTMCSGIDYNDWVTMDVEKIRLFGQGD